MSIQVKKKFIKSQVIDGTKVLFLNEDAFKASKADGSQVSLFKVSSSDEFRLLQMPKVSSDPMVEDDLARKKYVDKSAMDAESNANVYTDGEITSLQGDMQAADAALQASISAEKTRAEGEESRIEGKVDAEIAARIAAIAAEAAARAAADTALAADLDAEELARQAGDTALQTALDSEQSAREQADAELAADIVAEETARIAGDTALQSAINVEKGRVDAILLASEADKDSFAEIVQLINSVDTENDSAFAAYVLSNNAALAQEVANRQAGDTALAADLDAEEAARQAADSAEAAARAAADAALDARLDVLEADPVTKTYVDGKVANLTSDINDLDGYAQDIRDDLDQEILDRAAAVSAEAAARAAADTALAADLDAEEAARIAGDAALQSGLNTEISARQAAVSAEAAARQAADGVLDAKIDQKYSDAVSYTDTKVAALVNSAPAVLDTLKELADALGSDPNFATTVAGQIGVEQSAREAADAALDARLDALEGSGSGSVSFELNAYGERFLSESFVVDASMISDGYFDLDFKAFAPSMVVSLDRLMLFEGEDFSVSVVGGVSRLTFIGSILPAGEEALAAGDKIKVRYLKDVR